MPRSHHVHVSFDPARKARLDVLRGEAGMGTYLLKLFDVEVERVARGEKPLVGGRWGQTALVSAELAALNATVAPVAPEEPTPVASGGE